ncbi:MAG: LysM peptidoglycan-binding domain-containing protein [Clostridia bacterium]|nr:LysM peptidoglycan-binding domain-containing protein [Clostridia bacterium]
MKIQKVRNNECIMDIAEEYNINPLVIASVNGLDIGSRLTPGQELLVLMPTRVVNVKRGQGLDEICLRFSISEEQLLAYNPILGGRRKIYDGQMLCIKYATPCLGVAVKNGYMYSGCSIRTLSERLCYTDIITVCSLVWRDEKLCTLFDETEAMRLAQESGKRCFVRVYITDSIDESNIEGFVRAVALYTANRNYSGATIGGIEKISSKKGLADKLKDALCELGKELFIECAAGETGEHISSCDGAILSYDKINLEQIPSFKDGEIKAYMSCVEGLDSYRCLMELSSFAYGGGRFVERARVINAAMAKGAEIVQDDERLVSEVIIGGRKPSKYIFESLENQKARLTLAGELGLCGISFDIARIGLAELMMIATAFSSPARLSGQGELNCRGEKYNS